MFDDDILDMMTYNDDGQSLYDVKHEYDGTPMDFNPSAAPHIIGW